MPPEPTEPPGAEEYVSISFKITRPVNPAAEKELRAAVDNAVGILPDSVHLTDEAVTLCYDPTRVSRQEVTEILNRTGIETKTARVDRAPFL